MLSFFAVPVICLVIILGTPLSAIMRWLCCDAVKFRLGGVHGTILSFYNILFHNGSYLCSFTAC